MRLSNSTPLMILFILAAQPLSPLWMEQRAVASTLPRFSCPAEDGRSLGIEMEPVAYVKRLVRNADLAEGRSDYRAAAQYWAKVANIIKGGKAGSCADLAAARYMEAWLLLSAEQRERATIPISPYKKRFIEAHQLRDTAVRKAAAVNKNADVIFQSEFTPASPTWKVRYLAFLDSAASGRALQETSDEEQMYMFNSLVSAQQVLSSLGLYDAALAMSNYWFNGKKMYSRPRFGFDSDQLKHYHLHRADVLTALSRNDEARDEYRKGRELAGAAPYSLGDFRTNWFRDWIQPASGEAQSLHLLDKAAESLSLNRRILRELIILRKNQCEPEHTSSAELPKGSMCYFSSRDSLQRGIHLIRLNIAIDLLALNKPGQAETELLDILRSETLTSDEAKAKLLTNELLGVSDVRSDVTHHLLNLALKHDRPKARLVAAMILSGVDKDLEVLSVRLFRDIEHHEAALRELESFTPGFWQAKEKYNQIERKVWQARQRIQHRIEELIKERQVGLSLDVGRQPLISSQSRGLPIRLKYKAWSDARPAPYTRLGPFLSPKRFASLPRYDWGNEEVIEINSYVTADDILWPLDPLYAAPEATCISHKQARH